jgi:hypothetical protein
MPLPVGKAGLPVQLPGLSGWTIASAAHVPQSAAFDEALSREQLATRFVRARHEHKRSGFETKGQRGV